MCTVLICCIYGCCFKSAFLSLWWKTCCIYVCSSKYMVAVWNLFFFSALYYLSSINDSWLEIGLLWFCSRNLAFWYLAYLVIQLQDEESQVFTSLLLYFVLFICFMYYRLAFIKFNYKIINWLILNSISRKRSLPVKERL